MLVGTDSCVNVSYDAPWPQLEGGWTVEGGLALENRKV